MLGHLWGRRGDAGRIVGMIGGRGDMTQLT
jgi:hypothetical protein